MEIDYNKWTVPTSWNEVTLKTFEEIERYYEESEKENIDIRDIVHIMCGKTKDEVNALPMEFLQIIFDHLSFMEENPEIGEPTPVIEIDGEKYIINIQNKLKTGEYVAAEMAIKADRHCFSSILAILCRKQGELYDADFEANMLEKRKEMFENQPLTKVLPICNFFLQLYITLETPSQLYTVIEQGVNDIAESLKSSTKIGLGRKLYIKWRMKRLQKLLRSIKST